MRILELRSENFKRLSVVEITPQGHIVEITGANSQGKTSVLDSIWAALGGKNAAPEQPIRVGHDSARIQLKIGDQPGAPVYIVERRFTPKDSYIKVTDAEGSKHAKPESILKALMGAIGFDPLAFMRMEPNKQFDTLRGLVKLDVDIDALNRKRATIYEERTLVGRLLRDAEGSAAAIAVPADLPDEKPDVAAVLERLANVDKHNAAIRDMHHKLDQITESRVSAALRLGNLKQQIADLESEVARAKDLYAELEIALQNAEAERQEAVRLVKEAGELIDSAEVAAELQRARAVEAGFLMQQHKIDALARVTALQRSHDEKTAAIDDIDATKRRAVADVKMPIDGLAFVEDSVVFKGLPLGAASAAEQLRVSAAIGAALNPKLRVLLVRDGSLLDSHSLKDLAEFAESTDTQIFIERVDESGEVGVVLVDGHVKGQEELVEAFERGEVTQSESTSSNVTQTDSPADDARMKRVREYIDAVLARIPEHVATRDLAALDRDNAEVKVKLQNFPEIIATEWNPKYLEAVRACKK